MGVGVWRLRVLILFAFFIRLSFIRWGAFFIGWGNSNGINGGEESWDPAEHWETGNGIGNGAGGSSGYINQPS